MGQGPQPLSASVRVTFGAQSHRGGARQSNNDHYLVVRLGRLQETLLTSLSAADLPPPFEEHGYVMLVADGIGEGGAGAIASRVALSTIANLALQYGKWNLRTDPATVSEIFEGAEMLYHRADAAVFTKSRTDDAMTGMTTTLTVAYSAGSDLFVAHVGHSRAYLFREGRLTCLTRDHTIERHLAETHRPASIERRAQDQGHILTDAIGARGAPPLVEVEQFQLRDGDCVLLCTNGLTDVVDDAAISGVLASRRQPMEQCGLLLELANQRGSEDNTTVVLAEYQIPVTKAESD